MTTDMELMLAPVERAVALETQKQSEQARLSAWLASARLREYAGASVRIYDRDIDLVVIHVSLN